MSVTPSIIIQFSYEEEIELRELHKRYRYNIITLKHNYVCATIITVSIYLLIIEYVNISYSKNLKKKILEILNINRKLKNMLHIIKL